MPLPQRPALIEAEHDDLDTAACDRLAAEAKVRNAA
jgi:hypothetical protein